MTSPITLYETNFEVFVFKAHLFQIDAFRFKYLFRMKRGGRLAKQDDGVLLSLAFCLKEALKLIVRDCPACFQMG